MRQLGFGYRAAFIASTLKTLRAFENVDEELARWRAAPLEETRERLLELKGVGRKVADCVQLMCMDQVSSFFRESFQSDAIFSSRSFPLTRIFMLLPCAILRFLQGSRASEPPRQHTTMYNLS